MIGSLEVTYELIFTIPSVIQISSINSIRLRFNLVKPRMSTLAHTVFCFISRQKLQRFIDLIGSFWRPREVSFSVNLHLILKGGDLREPNLKSIEIV